MQYVALRCRPTQVRWQLMVASCHRRSGNYQHALETYKSIHRKFPDNVECWFHKNIYDLEFHCKNSDLGQCFLWYWEYIKGVFPQVLDTFRTASTVNS